MDYYEGMLKQWYDYNNPFYSDLNVIGLIYLQIEKRLKVLEDNYVIHRDLKPDNILVKGNDHFAICDFGMSIMLSQDFKLPLIQSAIKWGARATMPPEIENINVPMGEIVSVDVSRADQYSLAKMIFKMIKMDDKNQYRQLKNKIGKEMIGLIKQQMNEDSKTRFSSQQMINIISVLLWGKELLNSHQKYQEKSLFEEWKEKQKRKLFNFVLNHKFSIHVLLELQLLTTLTFQNFQETLQILQLLNKNNAKSFQDPNEIQ